MKLKQYNNQSPKIEAISSHQKYFSRHTWTIDEKYGRDIIHNIFADIKYYTKMEHSMYYILSERNK